MNKLWNILWLLALSTTLYAAGYSVTGRVMDASSRKAVEFANVSIAREGETTPLTGEMSDKDGEFALTGLSNGRYILTVNFVGYVDARRPIVIDGQDVNIGKIWLKEDAKVLQEVEVVAQGSTMRFELDRKVFTVDQNLAAAGGSVTDALENVPSVDVDQEGNISLRNSENVEVWINGKPSGLTGDNRADILRQMPAESIKEIEIITNPSAKFSPEGTAGIINLVMKKDRKAGYYGSLNANIDYALSEPWTTPPGGRGGLNFNFSKSIVDGYFNVGYHYHSSNGRTINDRYNYDIDAAGDTTAITRLKRNGRTNRLGGGLFVRAGLDFHVTERSIIGVSGFGMVNTANDKTGGWFSSINKNNNSYDLYQVTNYVGPRNSANIDSLTQHYDRNQRGTGDHPGGNAMLDWRFEISKAHKLSMSAQFMQFGFNQDNFYEQTNQVTQEQLSENLDRSVQLKADYEWKPTKQSRLEAGWQTDLAWRKALVKAWDCDANDNRTAELLPYYNDFRNNEQTHALYITYGNRFWDKLSLQVGLRGEIYKRHITSDYYDATNTLTQYSADTLYFQLFPSVYIGYNFGKGHEMQVNYTRRIDRPRGHQINPRQDMSDPTYIQYGNPELNPQYSSSLELNYLKNWERHTISAGLFYRYAEKVTQNIRYRDAAIMRSTFINLGTRHEAGVELVGKNRLFKELLQLTTSVNFYYNRLDRATYTPTLNGQVFDQVVIPEQNIFAWSARLNMNFMFTKTFSAQISGRYRSPRVVAQGQTSHSYSIDIGLRKTFLNNALALQLNVRDLLDSRARRNTTSGDGFWQYQENSWHSRTIGIGLTYNFGNMRAKRNERQNNNSMSAADQYNDQGTDE